MVKVRRNFNIDDKYFEMLEELSKKDNRSMSNYLEVLIENKFNELKEEGKDKKKL